MVLWDAVFKFYGQKNTKEAKMKISVLTVRKSNLYIIICVGIQYQSAII